MDLSQPTFREIRPGSADSSDRQARVSSASRATAALIAAPALLSCDFDIVGSAASALYPRTAPPTTAESTATLCTSAVACACCSAADGPEEQLAQIRPRVHMSATVIAQPGGRSTRVGSGRASMILILPSAMHIGLSPITGSARPDPVASYWQRGTNGEGLPSRSNRRGGGAVRFCSDGAHRCCDVPTSYPRTTQCVLIPIRWTTGVYSPDLGMAGLKCRNRRSIGTVATTGRPFLI
jgi:hypothetical protein